MFFGHIWKYLKCSLGRERTFQKNISKEHFKRTCFLAAHLRVWWWVGGGATHAPAPHPPTPASQPAGRPATQPPSHPATQPPSHPATQPPSHPASQPASHPPTHLPSAQTSPLTPAMGGAPRAPQRRVQGKFLLMRELAHEQELAHSLTCRVGVGW